MKKKVCFLLRSAGSFLYFFVSSFVMPIIFLGAFNYSKGIAGNEDGIFLMPFYWLVLLGILALSVFLIIRLFRTTEVGIKIKIIILALYLLAVIVASAICLSLWEEFFRCFVWYIEHNGNPLNLARQV